MALVVVALLSVGYIVLKIGLFESFGLSVLASAGALGILVAIAARPLLSNMVAGLQIALTDPLRIGDVVVYDDHWATVEDISFAHTSVEMVEINGETAVLWVWVSGTTAFTSWHLHNDVREQPVAFLNALDGGAYLPRQRHILLTEAQDAAARGSEPLSPPPPGLAANTH